MECADITETEYHTRYGTALQDAIGLAISDLQQHVDKLMEDQKPGKVSFFITTDGEENSSKLYSQQEAKEMIIRKTEEDKWNFIFAGSNIDAFAAGERYGIQQQNIAQIAND